MLGEFWPLRQSGASTHRVLEKALPRDDMLAINTHLAPRLEGKEGIGVGISPSSTLDILPVPPRPAAPAPPPRTIAVSAHYLLRIQGGRAVAQGGSDLYEEGEVFVAHLGTGDEWADLPRRTLSEVSLPADAGACIEVAAGDLHSLFLCGGRVWSCGGGWHGALGHGDEGSHACPQPIAGSLMTLHVVHLAAGGAHSLAVTEGGALWSWGWGRHGQLGLGDKASRLSPCRVHAPSAVQVRAALRVRATPHPAPTSTRSTRPLSPCAASATDDTHGQAQPGVPTPCTATRRTHLVLSAHFRRSPRDARIRCFSPPTAPCMRSAPPRLASVAVPRLTMGRPSCCSRAVSTACATSVR